MATKHSVKSVILHFSICARHPCARPLLVFSASFQFLRMIPAGDPTASSQNGLLVMASPHSFQRVGGRVRNFVAQPSRNPYRSREPGLQSPAVELQPRRRRCSSVCVVFFYRHVARRSQCHTLVSWFDKASAHGAGDCRFESCRDHGDFYGYG